ncbi:MAG: serine hydrolase domain-containing protein [Acidobacteriota bacterium]
MNLRPFAPFSASVAVTATLIARLLLAIALMGPAAAEAACPLDGFPAPAGDIDHAYAEDLDAFITASLRYVGATPGLAVGIVENDRVIYARGFGRRDLEDCQPVTAATRFYLLSLTKSFTGMAAALLQERGELALDQPLTSFFPNLTMAAPINPAQTSLRDLLTHRPGFWNGGINYRSSAPGNLDDATIRYLLEKHSRPAAIDFTYSNLGYVIAAAAIRQATGKGWRQLLEEEIFARIGMAATTTDIAEAQRHEFARPYAMLQDGGFEPRPIKVQGQMHAAGGAVSTLGDLLRWVRLNLAEGRLDNQQVIPAAVVRQAHAPQIQYDWKFGDYHRFAYGLGLHNADLDGELTLHHFGGPIHLSFQPRRQRGLVVLSAGPDSTRFVHQLAAHLYRLLDRPADPPEAEDVFAELHELGQKRLGERAERRAQLAARQSPLHRPAASYAGTYRNDRLGEIQLLDRDGEVELRYGVLIQVLRPLEADTFAADLLPLGGSVSILEYQAEDGGALLWGERRFDRIAEP